MALQNIGASNRDDAFYRYKMPKMITKIEGRGNGIKTNVVNMVDIAKALARPATYTTKYFGCELGAQSKFDDKTGVSLVNGAHDTTKLAGLLEHFIKKYVQCYGCGNPETEIIITKTQMINLKCAACGFLSDVDMRDKLTTFILKNPPEQKKGSKDKKAMRRAEKERLKEGEAADEEMKKIKKETKKKAPSKSGSTKKKAPGSDEDHSSPTGSHADEEEEAADDDDDVQWQTDTSLEAARQRIQEQLSAATAEMVVLDVSESSKEKRKEDSISESSIEPPADEVVEENGKENGHGNGNSFDLLVSEIKSILKNGGTPGEVISSVQSLSEDAQDVMNALFLALFEGAGKGFSKEVTKKLGYLSAATGDSIEKKLQLLHAVEEFCVQSSPDAMKEVALALKVLYDADVVEEENVLQWYVEGVKNRNGETKSELWKKVKPFVEWLQSAESESDE